MAKHNPAGHLFDKSNDDSQGPVECLGMTFPDDNARREHFLGILREKLKDPEFRKIEGFPIGSDEDILALSDPPYYTACPNPFFIDFIKLYGKPYDPDEPYSREPFAVDVSEGKGDPIYNAHTYHTKVPHKAIMRYILHYTEPGDIVFDGFCGSGMTGIAAQLCSNRQAVEQLGYEVHKDGWIRSENGNAFSRIGTRLCIMGELSPAATHIARGYCTSFSDTGFAEEATRILQSLETSLGPLYVTVHQHSKASGTIDYTVWSDVFTCDNCGRPIVLWDAVMDPSTRRRVRRNEVPCTHCNQIGDIRKLPRAMEMYHDLNTNGMAKRVVQVPILIQYKYGGRRYEKVPDDADCALSRKCDDLLRSLDKPYPVLEMPDGLRKAKDAYHLRGVTHTHHFFQPRSLLAFAHLWDASSRQTGRLGHQLRFWLTSVALGFTKLNRYFESSYSQVNRYMKGAFYVAPFTAEVHPSYALRGKVKRLSQLTYANEGATIITTGSSGQLELPDDSVDYIFTDPPFGRNIQYSELNFIWEAWLGVRTNAANEAIVDETIGKQRDHYHALMYHCFREFHRVLKPGRWITVEFHNAENAIWTIIQEALLHAGFVVADVRVLDKQQITMQQWVGTNVVSKDLVISAYKPNGGLEGRFGLKAGTEEGLWDFLRTHLKNLPVFVSKGQRGETIAERQGFLLFDRMVAFHVQRGVTVPLSATEFYRGLVERFAERESMFFLHEQVALFDRKRTSVTEMLQLDLFVKDEASAIQWLKQQLTKKPQTFQEIHPQFLREIGGWSKNEAPLELSTLLEQNFLRYDGNGTVPSQIHSYLSTSFKELRNLPKDSLQLRTKGKDRWYVPDPNKAGDLEKLRERALLKEFGEYLPPGYKLAKPESQEGFLPGLDPKPTPIPRGKKMKVIRLEAVRAGFKHCWQNRDYRTIIAVAQRIPENVLQEDPKLLMWYDQAITRTGEN